MFEAHDYDAAVLMGVAAALGFAGAAIGLVGGAMAGVSVIIPIIGWAIFAVSLLLMWIINTWFRDTPIEKWAEHSPFSGTASNRLDHDEFKTLGQSLAGFQNLIMQPSATVEKTASGGMHRVTVTVNHPGFILDQSILEWEASATLNEMMQSGDPYVPLVKLSMNAPKDLKPVSIKSIGDANMITSTELVYTLPVAADETIEIPILPDKHVFRDNEWIFKFRHIMANGTSLPLNDSDFDQDKDSEFGWVINKWSTT